LALSFCPWLLLYSVVVAVVVVVCARWGLTVILLELAHITHDDFKCVTSLFTCV
jgi:hypothetical protein